MQRAARCSGRSGPGSAHERQPPLVGAAVVLAQPAVLLVQRAISRASRLRVADALEHIAVVLEQHEDAVAAGHEAGSERSTLPASSGTCSRAPPPPVSQPAP